MNLLIVKPTTVNARFIRCLLPIDERNDNNNLERCPAYRSAPGPRHKAGEIELLLDLDTAKVYNWPEGVKYNLFAHVVDEGSYWLLDEDMAVLAELIEYYVPSCIPSEYGDDVVMLIDGDGSIYHGTACRWVPNAREIAECFGLAVPKEAGR